MTREEVEAIMADACGESASARYRAGCVALAPVWLDTFDDVGIAGRCGYDLAEVRLVTARLRGSRLWALDEERRWTVQIPVDGGESEAAWDVGVALLVLVAAGEVVREDCAEA